MIYLIDGYNFLFSLEKEENLEKGRAWLIELLNQGTKKASLQLILIFDGSKPFEFSRSHFEALEIVFSPPGQTADDYILELLEHNFQKERYTLVSNDKRLGSFAKEYGTKRMGTATFFKMIQKKITKRVENSMSKPLLVEDRQLQRYLKIFTERYEDLL